MEHERVRRVAVRAEDLLAVRCEVERGDLRGGGKGMQACAGGGVPDVDGRVVGAAAGGEEGGLPGAPRDGL